MEQDRSLSSVEIWPVDKKPAPPNAVADETSYAQVTILKSSQLISRLIYMVHI